MPQQTISYKNEANPDRKALRDIIGYLGCNHNFKVLARALKAATEPQHLHQVNMICVFRLGIEGFPVFALMRRYAPAEVYQTYYDSLPD